METRSAARYKWNISENLMMISCHFIQSSCCGANFCWFRWAHDIKRIRASTRIHYEITNHATLFFNLLFNEAIRVFHVSVGMITFSYFMETICINRIAWEIRPTGNIEPNFLPVSIVCRYYMEPNSCRHCPVVNCAHNQPLKETVKYWINPHLRWLPKRFALKCTQSR